MRTITHLDEDDIRRIIAKHFEVQTKDVTIDCYMETFGYGPNEHEEPVVRATIEENVVRVYNNYDEE